MNHRMKVWTRRLVAACGLLLAVIGLTAGDRAHADEKAAAAAVAALVGTWEYAEDRTPPENGRDPREKPPMGARFRVTHDGKAFVVEHSRRGAPHTSRIALDGSEDVQKTGDTTLTASGRLEAGALTFTESRTTERAGQQSTFSTEFTLTPEKDGLLLRMLIPTPVRIDRTAFYRRGADIPDPKPAKCTISALAWLGGRFTVSGTSGSGKKMEMEEHWGPPGGGAMLGTARTVVSDRMTSFEFLRIVERNGGLVYVAQPGGGPAVEFVLTEISETRALFENPRHDYPKRILYERLAADEAGTDGLRTEISDKGGERPHASSYRRAK